MESTYTMDQIRRYWTQQADQHKSSFKASWSDHRAIDLEIHAIAQYIEDGDKVIDIGCANGYSTVQYAVQKKAHFTGIDFIPDMITEAQTRKDELAGKLRGRIDFEIGDILALNRCREEYDKAVVTRVIINLNNWENQNKALQNCAALVKSGGLLLLSEATRQGWQKLNKLRRDWGMPDIPVPKFNCYLDEDQVIAALDPVMRLVELKNFSSTYYVGTRVIKPLLSAALGNKVDPADPDMEWNRWFSQLPSWGDYGTQKLFVFEKVRQN